MVEISDRFNWDANRWEILKKIIFFEEKKSLSNKDFKGKYYMTSVFKY